MISRGSAEVEIERLTFEDIRTGRWRSDDDDEDEQEGMTRLASAAPSEPEAPMAVAVPRAVGRAGVAPSTLTPMNNPSAANSMGLAFDADPILALAARLDQAKPLAVPDTGRAF